MACKAGAPGEAVDRRLLEKVLLFACLAVALGWVLALMIAPLL